MAFFLNLLLAGVLAEVCRELAMVQETNDGIHKDVGLEIQQNRPAFSLEMKIKKTRKIKPPSLGMFRPVVGQCCHRCTPNSLHKKLVQSSSLGFCNLLRINETQTRYRGWLVRRVCCALFAIGRKVNTSPVGNRMEGVCQSIRVKEALTAEHPAPELGASPGQINHLSPFLPLINTCILPSLLRFVAWVMLKMFASIFDSIQVNLNHLPALHRASQEGSQLVYVHVRQSLVDCALISLVLFCHNLTIPYTVYPLHIRSYTLRAILQKIGVVPLPASALTEQDAENDGLYSPVMTSLVRELLREGQAISVGLSVETGQGGAWLARIRQLIKEGSVTDVSLVPVGISYDNVPKTNIQVGLRSVLQWLWSLLWTTPGGSVRIHFAQPFSLKEMCESRRCNIHEWLPLQDLLLPVILNRSDAVFGGRRMRWLLPSEHKEAADPERDLCIMIILHLMYSATSCMAVMPTGLVSSLLLYRRRKGVRVSLLCRDVAWLMGEVLLRNRDVGFGGSLVEIVHYSLSLLAPHLIIAAAPSKKDPFIVPRPTLAATLHLYLQAQVVTHTFILEAVGACAVSAMLCEVARSGVGSRIRSDAVDWEEAKGDLEFDVVLCQSELTERALQLSHLLPPGFMPPCQLSQSFALDAVDSLVSCGILIMEENTRNAPVCDFWKKEGTLTWATTDDPYRSESDCEEQDLHSYKISQPKQCPEMLFFLCSMLAGHLRALCWTIAGLELLHTPLPEAEFVAQIHSHLYDTANKKKQHYESCSEEAARTAARTLIDLGVLSEARRDGVVFLSVSPLFQLAENRQKLHCFISQYLFN
ncbi:glycerol-3-phosphate acyltransferase 2, mitochondrial [Brachionichthys hirsutus]|uniref:glycerol-3-phosphate acyltransferase 2, mitochondrial n=1 Tax=Brachionichthys hirsutus TaxID=412623 RepID=UPI003605196A